MNNLHTCSYRCQDFAGNNLLPMILPASALNSCMIEFSIPDFNETIIKNIISLFLSFSNTEWREVVFRTQWFISQILQRTRGEGTVFAVHFSTEERAYLCRCTSFPFYDAFCDCIPLTLAKSIRFLTLSRNHRRESKVLFFSYYYYTACCISSFSQCPTGHESRRFRCQCRVKFIEF